MYFLVKLQNIYVNFKCTLCRGIESFLLVATFVVYGANAPHINKKGITDANVNILTVIPFLSTYGCFASMNDSLFAHYSPVLAWNVL